MALVIIMVVVNTVVLGAAVAPLFVTYAKLPAVAVACGRCAEPEVQRALAEAGAVVRGELASRIVGMWPWWLLLFIMNAAAPIVAWRVARGRSAV